MRRILTIALAVCLLAGTARASAMISYSWLSYSYSPRDIAYAGGPGELCAGRLYTRVTSHLRPSPRRRC